MSHFDDSLNLDESAYQPGSAHSPVTLISNDFLPQGVTVGNVVAYQTPMIVETPALHHDSSDYIHDAVESINQMRSDLEARLNTLEGKIELIANIHRGMSASVSPAGDTTTIPIPERSSGPEHDTPDAKISQAIPTHNMIILTPDQLDKLVEEKVTTKLVEFQKSLYDQTYAEVRLRNLESSLDSINKSITNLSAHSASFPANQATIRPPTLTQHNSSEANDVYPAYTYNQRAARPGMISLDVSTQNSHRPTSVQNLYDVVEGGQTNLSALGYSANPSGHPSLYKSSGETTSSVMRKSYVPNSIIQTPVSQPTLGLFSQNTGAVQDIINEIRHRSGIQVSS